MRGERRRVLNGNHRESVCFCISLQWLLQFGSCCGTTTIKLRQKKKRSTILVEGLTEENGLLGCPISRYACGSDGAKVLIRYLWVRSTTSTQDDYPVMIK